MCVIVQKVSRTTGWQSPLQKFSALKIWHSTVEHLCHYFRSTTVKWLTLQKLYSTDGDQGIYMCTWELAYVGRDWWNGCGFPEHIHDYLVQTCRHHCAKLLEDSTAPHCGTYRSYIHVSIALSHLHMYIYI